MEELHLTKKDFRVDWYSGTGAGGQYRNKHQNCCRITHIESGLSATGQSNRERPANQKEAFKKLVGRLLTYYGIGEKSEKGIGTNVIRTYHAERNEVIDGDSRKRFGEVIDGDIDDFLVEALTHGRSKKGTGRM